MTKDSILQQPAGQVLDSAVAMEVYGYEYLEVGYWQTNGPPKSQTAERQTQLRDWLKTPAIVEQTDNSVGEYWIMPADNLILRLKDLSPSQDVRDAAALWKYCIWKFGKEKFAACLCDALQIGVSSETSAVQAVVDRLSPLAVCHAALLCLLHA